ncbi:MAG: S8 family serine peptidase [Lachnospiraceae bacterium]|nr:S8 family serine peptidase [Lachnospiraceae bacterium]
MMFRNTVLPALLSVSVLAGSFAFPAEIFAADETEEIAIVLDGADVDEAGELQQTESLPEVTEPESLPYGLKGMPDGFTLSEDALSMKEDSRAHDEAGALSDLKAGEDYEKNTVFFPAENEEYAKAVAEAYNATLLSFSYGIAEILLDPEVITVSQAVALGSDPGNNLPAVSPNYITKAVEPVPADDSVQEGAVDASFAAVVPKSDHTYWSQVFDDPALDPYYTKEGSNSYQWMHDMIGTYEAWGTTTGSSEITVAVIDTGVYKDHEELKGRVDRIDVMENPIDNSGHGTHVAGIIAAAGGNGAGGIGIAPGVRILSLPVFKGPYCESSDEVRAINAAVTAGADIINMSLGGYSYESVYHDVVKKARKAGVTIVAAMGNENSNDPNYPSAYPEVIAVSAVNQNGTRSWFSTYGSWADIAAPGCHIFSSWNGHNDSTQDVDTGSSSRYEVMDGTSMATPVVAGACALYMSAAGHHVDPDTMEKVLKEKATKISDPSLGAGIVNVAAMIPCNTDAPVITADSGELEKLTRASQIQLSAKAYADHSFGYVYTTDGKDPALKDGAVTRGYFSEDGVIPVSMLLDNKTVAAGETICFKAAAVTAKGKLGKIRKTELLITGDSKAIAIKGPGFIARGKSASYKALYETAALKKAGTTWSLTESVPGVSVNRKNGKVTVSRNTEASSFTLMAVSKSDPSVFTSIVVEVVAPASAVTVTALDPDQTINQPTEKNGSLTGIRLYNVDPSNTPFNENTIRLQGKTDGNTSCPVFSSSNEGIASVSEISAADGITVAEITGHKAGKAKITCKAGDGSGKKAVVTVQVIVPASSVTIVNLKNQETIAWGKNTQLKAALGQAYGKPSVKKVTWEVASLTGYDLKKSDGKIVAPVEKTEVPISKSAVLDYVTLDQNGKLTAKKALRDLGHDYYDVTVSATTKDGTALTGAYTIHVEAPATRMQTGYIGEDRKFNKTNGRVSLSLKEDNSGVLVAVETDNAFCTTMGTDRAPFLIVKSSNPKVASGFIYSVLHSKSAGMLYYQIAIIPNKKGTTVITARANDGSGKKTTFRVTVK